MPSLSTFGSRHALSHFTSSFSSSRTRNSLHLLLMRTIGAETCASINAPNSAFSDTRQNALGAVIYRYQAFHAHSGLGAVISAPIRSAAP